MVSILKNRISSPSFVTGAERAKRWVPNVIVEEDEEGHGVENGTNGYLSEETATSGPEDSEDESFSDDEDNIVRLSDIKLHAINNDPNDGENMNNSSSDIEDPNDHKDSESNDSITNPNLTNLGQPQTHSRMTCKEWINTVTLKNVHVTHGTDTKLMKQLHGNTRSKEKLI